MWGGTEQSGDKSKLKIVEWPKGSLLHQDEDQENDNANPPSSTAYLPSDPIFIKYKILPFKAHVQLRKAIFMWKLTQGYAPDVIFNLFTPNLHNELKFVLPFTNNEKGKKYFVYTCIKEWNCVPDTIKSSTTFTSFRDKYKTHLLESI